MMSRRTQGRLRLALPENRDLPQLCLQFQACGFALEALPGTEGIVHAKNPLGDGLDFDVFTLAPKDIGVYVQHGIAQLGVTSTDFIRESDAQVWRPFTFSYGVYPLVLAAPMGITFDVLASRPLVRLATSLPNWTRDLFSARGMKVEVVRVEDCATACLLGLADGYIDRLMDPQSMVQAGFRVLEVLGYSRLKLLINPSSYASHHEAMTTLRQCLGDHQPAEPPPINVPFDFEGF